MTTQQLIDEFRRAYVAGERPDAADFLTRAGDAHRHAVGSGIRLVLAEEPPPDPAPETLLLVQAMLRGEQPLIALRASKGLTRDAVVHRLRELLGLAPEREPKVAGYYHDLETGQLPLAGIRDRVFDALAQAFGVARSTLMLNGPDLRQAGDGLSAFAMARGADSISLFQISEVLMSASLGQPDEVDDLFTGGAG